MMPSCQVYTMGPGGVLVHCHEPAVARCDELRYCKTHREKLGGHGAPPHTFKGIPKRERGEAPRGGGSTVPGVQRNAAVR